MAVVFILRFADQIGIAHRDAATALAFQASFFLARRFELQVKEVTEGLCDIWQRDAVLRAFRPCQAGLDAAHVQRQTVGEHRLLTGQTPQPLGLGIRLHQFHHFRWPSGQTQVLQRYVIDREEAACRTVFRGHVGDGRTVSQRQVGEAITIKLDKFADHAFLAQHLRNGQHQVGGGDAFLEFAGEFEANHFRNQHRHRLPEHRRFRFDPADTPAEHAEAVDHGGVGVGANQRVGKGVGAAVFILGPHGAAEVFEVDLVADPGARRHYAEVVKGTLPPAQEGIAFAVALHFDVDVLLKCAGRGELVDHHRVVDHQIHRG
ncbi:hypothetical protein SRM1_03801 [Pseudomonas fluorescens]|nr:hypothetical protein SRM1_03801 [Pseudomonas fluorescens]